jgi:DNA-binding transcriptional ArsR family regulator
MSEINLDVKDIKALASDTRREILKVLDGRKLSLKEISNATQLHEVTVYEHLNTLIEAGLVDKKERQGHKWVYYKLSWKGASIIHPTKMRVILIFSIVAVVFISMVGVSILLNTMTPYEIEHATSEFEGIRIEASTDKNIYLIGEDVQISFQLINTNNNESILYYFGYKISIYDENYTKIWDSSSTVEKDNDLDHGIIINQSTHTINPNIMMFNASETITFNNICAWNQTAQDMWTSIYHHNQQIPPGIYNVIVEITIDISKYYEGPPYPYIPFSDSKKIIIE